MRKKFLLCLFFFMFTPLILSLTLFLSNFNLLAAEIDVVGTGKVLGSQVLVPPVSTMYLPSRGSFDSVEQSIKAERATPYIIKNYLSHYHSPLLPFVDEIIFYSDLHQINPLLLVAIAQQESNLGKKTPEGCFNAWGWGIHSKGTKCYQNWEEAIMSVAEGVAKDYCQKGYCDDPCVMMKKYTPNSNGSWCFGINQFLSEMESGKYN